MSQRGNSSTTRGKPKGRGKKRGNTNKQSTREGTNNKTENKRSGSQSQRGGKQGGKSRGTNNQKGNNSQKTKSGCDPVEKSKITIENPLSGKRQTVDLLSKANANMEEFLCFLPPDGNINLPETLKTLKLINQDASSLLKAKFHEFWSTVTYNASFTLFLDSFLRYWTSYNPLGEPNAIDELLFNNRKETVRPEVKERRSLFLNMWKIIYRLTHPNESASDWMSNYHYASLIRTQEIITIPTMIDICTHYSAYQRKGVAKMMSFLFEVQPSYYNDLDIIFEQIQTTLEQFMGNIQNFVAQSKTNEIATTAGASLWETIQFLYSIITSLLSFIEISPDEILIHLNDRRSLRGQFIILYEIVIPQMNNLMSSVDVPEAEEASRMIKITHNAVYALFSHLLNNCFITPLTKLQKIETYDTDLYSKEFIKLLGSLEDYSFVNFARAASLSAPEREQKILYLLVDELSLVQIICSFSNYYHAIDELVLGDLLKQIEPYSVSSQGKKTSVTTKVIHVDTPVVNDDGNQSKVPYTSISSTVSVPSVSPEREEKINSVKSILDFLGEGFINECLELYNDDIAVVCDRILSENLAEPLLELDRNMPLAKKTITTSAQVNNTPMTQVDTQKSSRLLTKDFIELPDEFSSFHIGKMKKMYEEKDDEEFREINKRFYRNVYDDEYDDSMDQYAHFEIDDGETEDERVSLTESGEYEQHEDTEQPTVFNDETSHATMSRKNKRKFQQRQKNKVQVSDAPTKTKK